MAGGSGGSSVFSAGGNTVFTAGGNTILNPGGSGGNTVFKASGNTMTMPRGGSGGNTVFTAGGRTMTVPRGGGSSGNTVFNINNIRTPGFNTLRNYNYTNTKVQIGFIFYKKGVFTFYLHFFIFY